MKLEVVTVCVNVADELKNIVSNRKFFDRWVVVTVAEDHQTIELCRDHDIDVVFSERIFADGAPFAKSKAINDGLQRCDRDGWLMLMDADILMPSDFREIFESIPQNELSFKSIFGPKLRRMVNHEPVEGVKYCTKQLASMNNVYKHYYDWFKEEIDANEPIAFERVKEFYEFIVDSKFYADTYPSIDEQWRYYHSNEWHKLPINFEGQQQHILGYFQLFHHSSNTTFPENAVDAHWDDVVFRNSYPDELQQVLDFEVVHVGMNSYIASAKKGQLITYPIPKNVTQEMMRPNVYFNYMDSSSYYKLAEKSVNAEKELESVY